MVDDEKLAAWQASTRMPERLAAEIVRWGRTQGAWTGVPYGTAFISHVFEESEYDAAQQLLAREGFLTREGGDYFIAPNAPGRTPT